MEDNQAITEDLAAMSMNFFAFFPPLVNEATNPNAKVTGFFANPAGPTGKRFAALGGQGISIVSYSKKQEEAMKFLEWFIKDDTQKKWAALGGYTCSQAVLKSAEFQNATPYNKAFYETMFMVKDFWAVPEYAELLTASSTSASIPSSSAARARPKETLDALAADWNATFKKYGRYKVGATWSAGEGICPSGLLSHPKREQGLGDHDDHLDPRSRAAMRGWSDLAIRNLFIIPTILFLIVFNIFPLIYSLGYSFTDFRASTKRRPISSGCRTIATCSPTRTSGTISPSPRNT